MSILEKIKNIVSVPEDDYYDDMPEEVNFKRPAAEEKTDSYSSSSYNSATYELSLIHI